MLDFGAIQHLMQFLSDTYGAIGSLLVGFVAWLMYQLRGEQKESREIRDQQTEAMQASVAVQQEFVKALGELKVAFIDMYSKIKNMESKS